MVNLKPFPTCVTDMLFQVVCDCVYVCFCLFVCLFFPEQVVVLI